MVSSWAAFFMMTLWTSTLGNRVEAWRFQPEEESSFLQPSYTYQAKARSYCSEGMEVVFAEGKKKKKCHCECKASDCGKMACPQGYVVEGQKCVAYKEVVHEAIPGRQESLACPAGSHLVGSRLTAPGADASPGGSIGGATMPGGGVGSPGGSIGDATMPGGGFGLPGGSGAGLPGSIGDATMPGGGFGLPGGSGAGLPGGGDARNLSPVGARPPAGLFVNGEDKAIASGSITCIADCGCDRSANGAHGLHSRYCDCAYEVKCPSATQLVIEQSAPVCLTAGIPERTELFTSWEKLTRECPDSFELQNGTECVKHVEVEVPAVPAVRRRLQCPSGDLEPCNGKILCLSDAACPRVEPAPGTRVSGCKATLEIGCEDGLELSEEGEELWCVFNGTPASKRMHRETVPVVEECPDGFTRSGDECARNDTKVIPAVPEEREGLACPVGQWVGAPAPVGSFVEVAQDTAAELLVAEPLPSQADLTCMVDCECPPALAQVQTDGCKCMQHLACDEPMKAVRTANGDVVCDYPGVPARREELRQEADSSLSCPGNSTYDAELNICTNPIEKCPVVVDVELDAKALACGPHTFEYIGYMFNQIHDFAAAAQKKVTVKKKNLFQACANNCISIYSKFSECATQDDASVCVGRAAKSGKVIRSIGNFSVPDDCKSLHYKEVPWLKKQPGCQDGWLKMPYNAIMPCKDMYGSEFNFQDNWGEAVSKVQEIATANYIRLSGEYVDKPFGSLSCREAACAKVDKVGQEMKFQNLGACLHWCIRKWSE